MAERNSIMAQMVEQLAALKNLGQESAKLEQELEICRLKNLQNEQESQDKNLKLAEEKKELSVLKSKTDAKSKELRDKRNEFTEG